MKRNVKKIISLVLCFCLFGNVMITTQAANESNTLGVTFSAKLDTSTIEVSDAEQTVTMKVNASKEVLLDGIQADIVWDSSVMSISSISNEDTRIDFTGSIDTEKGLIRWEGTDNIDQLENVTNIAVITFIIPANTPAGVYEVGVDDIQLTSNYGDYWEETASAVTTLTITEPADGYTASINTLTNEVSVDDQITVNVGISHSEDTTFAAGEVKLSYDNSLLTFNESASTLGTATVKVSEGTIILEDYGADKNFGTGVYVLVFDAIADGEATVTLTSASFVNKENAVKSDLISATLLSDSIDFTINKKQFDVTLPDIFVGSSSVTDGEDYTFALSDVDKYEYSNITATVDGVEVDVVDNGDGTYTIKNVTGTVEITGTRTEKSFSVTFEGNAGDEITDGADTATYNTDYTFTMPSAQGWSYALDSVTIGGTVYTGYTVENSVYTIPGSAITGDIVITVSKTDTEASVTVEGNGAGIAASYEPTVNMNEDYTLTVVPEAGYTYTITATMGGESATVIDNGNNTYTIENVTGDIVFTINSTVIVDGVTVSEYLTLDGTSMWLVKNDTTVADGKVPTYNNESMFWSEKYGTYCYLVIAETLTLDVVKTNVNITGGSAKTVSYDMDVNCTGKVDASDAQLTYNMYNAVYKEFTNDATVEKFLRADINVDGQINVEDATAIIAKILG